MDLASIDPFKVEASPELDTVIHRHLFPEDDPGLLPHYSSRRKDGLQVADRLEDDFGIEIRLGRLRMQEHKMYFARAGSHKESASEILAVSLSLAICRLAILLLQRSGGGPEALNNGNDEDLPPALPYRGGWED